MSAIAYGMFVASDRTSAKPTSHHSAFFTVSQISWGLPTWPRSTAAAMSVPIAIIRFVGLTRCSSTSWGTSTPAAFAAALRSASSRLPASLCLPSIRWVVCVSAGACSIGITSRSASAPNPADSAAIARSSPTSTAVDVSNSATSAPRRRSFVPVDAAVKSTIAGWPSTTITLRVFNAP